MLLAMNRVPFNKPFMTGNELRYIAQAHSNGHLAGDGYFTQKCSAWLEKRTGCEKALLTHSCTAALELAAMLIDLQPGDEVIMPSFTFVSTANAFVLRGAVPVFVDIRSDTLNIDERLIEAAITTRTRAIVPVHYAGVACDMDAIMAIAAKHELLVIEDAAQGVMASHRGRALGSIGHFGALSFHETKNIISGEGGALLINDPRFVERAEIMREKGTNRSQFFRGQVDKYTWVDIGSSLLPSELIAAFLWAQMEEADAITARRCSIWQSYREHLRLNEIVERLREPFLPDYCTNNAHMYYLVTQSLDERKSFINYMRLAGIQCVFHYVPLHSSPFGLKHGRALGRMTVTDEISDQLVRLPMWVGVENQQEQIVTLAREALRNGA